MGIDFDIDDIAKDLSEDVIKPTVSTKLTIDNLKETDLDDECDETFDPSKFDIDSEDEFADFQYDSEDALSDGEQEEMKKTAAIKVAKDAGKKHRGVAATSSKNKEPTIEMKKVNGKKRANKKKPALNEKENEPKEEEVEEQPAKKKVKAAKKEPVVKVSAKKETAAKPAKKEAAVKAAAKKAAAKPAKKEAVAVKPVTETASKRPTRAAAVKKVMEVEEIEPTKQKKLAKASNGIEKKKKDTKISDKKLKAAAEQLSKSKPEVSGKTVKLVKRSNLKKTKKA